MDVGSGFDIVIGIAQVSLVLFLAWRAFIVSLKPPVKKDHAKQKRLFAICCVSAILLSGTQIYRSTGVNRILEKIESNTEVNLHTHVELLGPFGITGDPYLPYVEGHSPQVGVVYQDVGEPPAQNSFLSLGLDVVPLPLSEPGEQSVWHTSQLHRYVVTSGTLNPHSPGRAASITTRSALTKNDVNGLNNGSLQLCLTARILWEDATGQYCEHALRCFARERNMEPPVFNWHYQGQQFNREKKCGYHDASGLGPD